MTTHDRTLNQRDQLLAYRREMNELLMKLEARLDESRELVSEFKAIREMNRRARDEFGVARLPHEDV
ncbi:MAG: hypothetical protein ACU0GG_17795 [Paracoccaceae bacterium]